MSCADTSTAFAAYAASDFNREALAISQAAYALHGQIRAFLDQQQGAAATGEFGQGIDWDMASAVVDMSGFLWTLNLFAGLVRGVCVEDADL